MAVTIGEMKLDVEEIAYWIAGIRKVLSQPNVSIKVNTHWDPPPTATPAPVASPKCKCPMRPSPPATTAKELIDALNVLYDWTCSVSLNLGKLDSRTAIPGAPLPPTTPIPPPKLPV